jgi:hypothetical protein
MKIIAYFLGGRSIHVSVNKTDSATLPILYTISSQPIRRLRIISIIADCRLPIAIFVSSGDFQAMEDKNQRSQDSGNIFHPMLVFKETTNCSY